MKPDATPAPSNSPELGDLRAFCLVVDLGSITAASRALGEAKGSVSRRLTRLEALLGVTLLRRTPRLVQATEVGAAYRARLGRALELLDDATEQAREAHDQPTGRLRVTAAIDVGQSLLAPLVAEFVERFPEVTVEMVLSGEVLDFDAHQIDVALRAGVLRDSNLIAHKVDVAEARLFAAPAYLERRGTPASPSELAHHRLVLTRVSGTEPTLALRHGDGAPEEVLVRPSIVALDFMFAKEVALAGGGIAMLPTLIARRELAAGSLVAVLPEHWTFRGSLYLVHHGARFLPPKVRAFRDFVIAACRGRERATR